MFTHWLVSVKNFDLSEPNYWKIAPGRNAIWWDQCRANGYISLGWEKIGDLTGLSKDQYHDLYADVMQSDSGYTLAGRNTLARFWKTIKEGDRIVANRGTKSVLGIGTVVGSWGTQRTATAYITKLTADSSITKRTTSVELTEN